MAEPSGDWQVEFDELVVKLTSDSLTPEESERLENLLESRPDAHRRLAEQMQIVSMLETEPLVQLVENDFTGPHFQVEKDSPQPSSLKTIVWDRRHSAVIAGVGLIAMLVGMFLPKSVLQQHAIDSASLSFQSTEETDHDGVAVVTQALDPVCGDGTDLTVGTTVSPRMMELESGVIQLEFYHGASVVVDGPAKIELVDAMSLVCHRGKLRVRIPDSNEDFSVVTPHATVADSDSEFGINVGGKGDRIQVFSGTVEIQPIDSSRQIEKQLSTNDAIWVSADGSVREVNSGESRFVSSEVLRKRVVHAKKSRLANWRRYIEGLKQDPRVLALYAFEPDPVAERVLKGTIDGGREREAQVDRGAIVGGRWVEGRWPGKMALDYKRPSDRVRVNIPGAYESLTFSAWVRVDGLDRILNGLFTTNYFGVGGIQWQMSRRGMPILAIRHHNKGKKYRGKSVVDLSQLGRWIHITTVYDSKKKQVVHYANGKKISQEPIIARSTVLKLGKSEIGNWGRRLPNKKKKIRNFNGRIDEFVVFRKALSEEEVRVHYRAGKP